MGGAEGLSTRVGGGAEEQWHLQAVGGAGGPRLSHVVGMEGVGLLWGGAPIVAVVTEEVELGTPRGMGSKQFQEAVQVEEGSAPSADRRVRGHSTLLLLHTAVPCCRYILYVLRHTA